MSPGTKLAAFGLVLAAMVGGGAAIGSAVGPIDVGDGAEHPSGHDADTPSSVPVPAADRGHGH